MFFQAKHEFQEENVRFIHGTIWRHFMTDVEVQKE